MEEDFDNLEPLENTPLNSIPPELQDPDFIDVLLKSRGIDDKTLIQFETDNGIENVNWSDLSNEDRLNIINTSSHSPEEDLDENEILLLNTIRSSGLSPQEYLENVEKNGIEKYNSANYSPVYLIDQYTDDELFVADFMSRMGDVTEEEAKEALEKAKSNETLFAKQIGAIRKEYKTIEEENLKLALIELEEQAQVLWNLFTNAVEQEINQFTEFSGYDLNMGQEDMQMLYDFITGVDSAGNNYFAKALADPKTLVLTAWLALNGKQMIDDITTYYLKLISEVRKESYNKGLADAKADKSNVIYKPKESSKDTFDSLDDF